MKMTDLINELIKEREDAIYASNMKLPVEKRIRFKEDQRWNDLQKLSSGIASMLLDCLKLEEELQKLRAKETA